MTEGKKIEIREQLGVILLAAVLVMSGLLLIKQKDEPATFKAAESTVTVVDSNENIEVKSQTTSETKQTGLVNINSASLEDLDTLPGIGEKTAQKIIDYRNSNGGFKDKEELLEVSGIGESKYEAVKDLIAI